MERTEFTTTRVFIQHIV